MLTVEEEAPWQFYGPSTLDVAGDVSIDGAFWSVAPAVFAKNQLLGQTGLSVTA
jgi:hypothetical protein